MIAVFIPYIITLNQTANINESLNIRIAHPYDKFWESGIGKNFSSNVEYFCNQLRRPIYVSGKHEYPSIGYRLGGKGGRIGKIQCPKGLVIDIGAMNVILKV